jgi:hypothetical protein
VYVNSTTHNVSYGIEFYTLGHFSKFVLPGAYRIYSSEGAGVDTAAFLNPDNSKVLVAFNDTANSATFQVQWGNRSFPYTLAAYSGATFTWSGTPSGGYTVNPTNLIVASSFNSVSALQTEPTTDTLGGYDLGYASAGSYAAYSNVDLGNGFTNVIGRLASAGTGGTLEFHIDSATGPMLGSVTVPITGGWQTWQSVTGLVTGGAGVHTLFARFNGSSSIGNVNWFQFAGAVLPLPAPWSSADIGSIGLAGSAALAGGTFTLNGSGDDIWNTADAFHFVSQPAGGNCEIRARVTALQPTDPWAKAGIMIRDSAAAGAMNASVVLAASNSVSFQVRSGTGAATTSTVVGVGTLKTPLWLRLVRASENSFAGYYSADGVIWTQVGASVPLALNNNALAGLALTAHNNASNCVATFDNVSVNQFPVLAPIADQAILAGRTLLITNQASDADIPAQMLTYSLLNAPAGAGINASSGLFTWRPAISQSPSSQTLSVIVADNGIPSMVATQKFAVTVNRPAIPLLSSPSATNGQFGVWISGDVGPDYLVQTSSNLLSWSVISTSTPSAMPFWLTITNNVLSPAQFYRVVLGP